MTRLTLIRHAAPVAAHGTPPAQWPLTRQGRNDASLLGRRLADSSTTAVWTSPEHKARETAALAFPAAVTHIRDQLREVTRGWYASSTDLANAVANYLNGEIVEGWEHQQDVIARLTLLKAEALPQQRLVIVSHGVLLTTWVDHEIGLQDPFSFWSNLRAPDAWELDLENKALQRLT